MLTNVTNIVNPVTFGFIVAVLLLVVFLFWKNTNHADEKGSPVMSAIVVMGMFLGLAAIMIHSSPMFAKIVETMNPLTMGFIGVITLFAVYFHSNYTPTIAHKAPAVLTTLGILGTFLGIAVGLTEFNPNDIQNSVPALIDGMKTAFWASACGIFFAITIKLRDVMQGDTKRANRFNTATINDLVTQLSSLLNQAKLSNRDSNERLDLIHMLLRENIVVNDNRIQFAANPLKLEMVG